MMDQLLRGAEEHAAACIDDLVIYTAKCGGNTSGYPYSAQSCKINGMQDLKNANWG